MAIRLYGYWRSSAAYRVRIALHLKGLDWEYIPVSLLPGVSEHRKDAYRQKNPQGEQYGMGRKTGAANR